MVEVAREFAAGSLGLAADDFTRNGYEGTWNEEESAAAVHSTRVLHDGLGVLARTTPSWRRGGRALEHLPPTPSAARCGRCTSPAGFTFPGTPGSAPPLLAQHDWVHVLADYGTTVESEVEVFGLIARANDDMHAFSLLAMVISLFETGYLETGAGLFESSPGPLLVEPAHGGAAGRRHATGARCCHDAETGSDSIDFLKMDWFAVAHAHLRRPAGALPPGAKSAAAVAAGLRRPLGARRHQPVPDERRPRAGRGAAACPTTPTARRPERRSGLEEAQHGQHPPVVLLGDREVELGEDVGDVLLDGALADDQRVGDGARWSGPRP